MREKNRTNEFWSSDKTEPERELRIEKMRKNTQQALRLSYTNLKSIANSPKYNLGKSRHKRAQMNGVKRGNKEQIAIKGRLKKQLNPVMGTLVR